MRGDWCASALRTSGVTARWYLKYIWHTGWMSLLDQWRTRFIEP